jgi:predicted nucleic acid-binding protein
VRLLAREQQLLAYDAAFLELALRRALPLATHDNRLRTVALRLGVPLVDDGGNGVGNENLPPA